MSYHLLANISTTSKFCYDRFFNASEFISYELQFTRYKKDNYKKSLILDSIDNMINITTTITEQYQEYLESSDYEPEIKYYKSKIFEFTDFIKSLNHHKNNIL